jgi:hypothetical protein
MASEYAPGSGISDREIYDLLLSIQNNQKQLERQLKDLELRIDWIGRESENELSIADTSTLIGAIDQGTSSSRFLIFNRHGEIVASHQKEFKQIHPNPG